jgi:hypothetical protein
MRRQVFWLLALCLLIVPVVDRAVIGAIEAVAAPVVRWLVHTLIPS